MILLQKVDSKQGKGVICGKGSLFLSALLMKMPSASSKSSTMASQLPSLDGQDPLKVVVQMMEKKVRNLEKRKTKLDSYKKLASSGQELNEDQTQAVAKIDVVENNLDFAREFHQTFRQLELEHAKQLKREQKRLRQDLKEQAQGDKHVMVTRIVEVQCLLEGLSEEVRPDFLSGTNRAVQLTEDDFEKLDGIYKLITPSQNEDTTVLSEQVTSASDHLHNLVEEKDKPILDSTYKEVYSILKKVKDCGYFDKASEEGEKEELGEEEATEEPEAAGAEEDAEEEEEVEEESREIEKEEEGEAPEDNEDEEEAPTTYEETETLEEEETENAPEESSATGEEPVVNGVDLPGDFTATGETDQTLDFMGESEVHPPVTTPIASQMSASSPEFIPRSLQSQTSDPSDPNTASSGWGQDDDSGWQESQDNDNGGWTEVSANDNQQHQQGGRFGQGRGGRGGRGRGFGGGYGGGYGGRPRGGRGGRGGYGQQNNGSRDYGSRDFGQNRDGFQRRGGHRGGPRGPRGGRGGPRGAPRGGPRGGGFGNPSQQ